MPTIDFRTFDGDAFENFRPVLAKNYHPEWWKKAKVKVHHRSQIVQTLRSCPAMDDYLKLGWYIIATQDIPVMNGHDWNFPEESEVFVTNPECPIRSPSHGSSQFEDIFGKCTIGIHIWQLHDCKAHGEVHGWDAHA